MKDREEKLFLQHKSIIFSQFFPKTPLNVWISNAKIHSTLSCRYIVKIRTRYCTLYRGFRKYRISWGMNILSVIPGNPLLWTFLMQNLNLGIAKISVISKNPEFLKPVRPKTSVFLGNKVSQSESGIRLELVLLIVEAGMILEELTISGESRGIIPG